MDTQNLVRLGIIGKDVIVYEDGIMDAQILPGIAPQTNILEDFLQQIRTGDSQKTQSVLNATETALTIQRAANQ